jgi:cell division protein FtsB
MAGSKKNREQDRQSGRGNIVLAVLVVVILLAVLYINGSSMQRKLDGYRNHIAGLEQQLEEEEQRSRYIEEYRQYTQTDEFIEQIAREKLGLLYKGEIIFREEDSR